MTRQSRQRHVSCGFMARGDMQNDYVATTGRNAAFCYMPSGDWP